MTSELHAWALNRIKVFDLKLLRNAFKSVRLTLKVKALILASIIKNPQREGREGTLKGLNRREGTKAFVRNKSIVDVISMGEMHGKRDNL